MIKQEIIEKFLHNKDKEQLQADLEVIDYLKCKVKNHEDLEVLQKEIKKRLETL